MLGSSEEEKDCLSYIKPSGFAQGCVNIGGFLPSFKVDGTVCSYAPGRVFVGSFCHYLIMLLREVHAGRQ